MIQDQNNQLSRQDERLRELDQRLAEYNRKLAAHHRERMSLRVSELERFGQLASIQEKIRPIHGADIESDFQAIQFLQQEDKWTRMDLAVDGFKARYGISRNDCSTLAIPDAPSEIVFTINARSDIEYLHAYRHHDKAILAGMCDEVIRRWRDYIFTAPDRREYPQSAIDKKVRELKSVL